MVASDLPRMEPHPLEFRGKVALVVGASRGIGAAAARAFARKGARVVVSSRDAESLTTLARSISQEGGEASVQAVDLADPASVERLGQFLDERFGRLDCAFNNAGEGATPLPLAEVPPAAFERAMRVTVLGTFLALREEIPRMLKAGGGAIVNMSSTAGLSAFAGGGAYVTAKHAILGLTKSAALDYAARKVRVNALAPGPIDTHRLAAAPEEYRERARQAVPMRRLGEAEEVASAVLWLCHDASSFVTGATLSVDGGRLAGVA